MNREQRHRALRAWHVASAEGLPIAEVLGWSDDAISDALVRLLRGAP